MDDLRVLIVGDNPLARAGLQAMLDQQPGCVLIGQTAGDANLVDALDVYQPDILVWDVGWEPDVGHLQPLVAADYPILTLVPDVERAVQVWEAQVQGLVLRTIDVDVLVQAMRAVAMRLTVIDPQLVDAISSFSTSVTDLEEPLTPREQEVLQLLAEGLSNKTIAFSLGISDHTVKFHVNAIMTKLDAQSRTAAAVKAARLGLISL